MSITQEQIQKAAGRASSFVRKKRLGLGEQEEAVDEVVEDEVTDEITGNRIPILKMLENGLSESDINQRVLSYQSQGHYVDSGDFEKYNAMLPTHRRQLEAKDKAKEGYLENIGKIFKKRTSEISEAFKGEVGESGIDQALLQQLRERGMEDKIKELSEISTQRSIPRALFRTAGSVAGGAFDILGETIIGGAKLAGKALSGITPDPLEEKIVGGAKFLAESTPGQFIIGGINSGITAVTDKFKELEAADPELFKDIRSGANIAMAVPVGKVTKAIFDKSVPAIKGAIAGAKGITPSVAIADLGGALKKGGKGISNLSDDALKAISATDDNIASRAASRILYNKKQAQLIDDVLAKAPKAVSKAVNQGVNIKDANIIANSTRAELNVMQEMIEKASKEALGEIVEDPRALVGKPLLNMFKTVEDAKSSVGKKLGALTKTIPKEKMAGLQDDALKAMQNISGLDTLTTKTDDLGKLVLDYSKTSISKNKTAQKAISTYFDDLADLTADQVHKRRQEIFEFLGGKKSAGIVLNATEKNALSSIRKTAMDTLDNTVPGYQALNKEYAIIEDALGGFRNKLKAVTGASDDILELRGAELARRLTSNASADMKATLETLETVARQVGYNEDISVTQLQELLNVLDQYMGIQKRTSLQGEVGKALTKGVPTSTRDVISKAIGGAAKSVGLQETEATLQGALKTLVEELAK